MGYKDIVSLGGVSRIHVLIDRSTFNQNRRFKWHMADTEFSTNDNVGVRNESIRAFRTEKITGLQSANPCSLSTISIGSRKVTKVHA